MRNKLALLFFLLGILILLAVVISIKSSKTVSVPISSIKPIGSEFQEVLVIRVIDGDTFQISGGEKVRYVGIDAPETVDPEKSVQCFGKESYRADKELIEGKKVLLQKDISEKDKYGRLLRYVFLNNVFINDYLVRNGYARAVSYFPDVKYQQQFLEAQRQAKLKNIGLWKSC